MYRTWHETPARKLFYEYRTKQEAKAMAKFLIAMYRGKAWVEYNGALIYSIEIQVIEKSYD